MPLTITTRVEDNFGILELNGPLTLGPSLVSLRNNARQLMEGQKLNGLILQVSSVTQTDSSGLGELTVVYTLASKNGCGLRLVAVKPEMIKLLDLTRLSRLLPTAGDIPTAKAELKKDSR